MTQRNAATKLASDKRVRELIHRMVRRIVRQFRPEKIILFGSQAQGTPTADSDVDLLVLMPLPRGRLDKADKEIEIGCALRGMRIPKDILVATPEEFERRKDIVGTISYEAARAGKVLYARRV